MNTNTVAQSDYAANAYTENVQQTTKKSAVTNGKTIGNPQLSEKAQKYYEQLKKKFSNMDFILVSADKKEDYVTVTASSVEELLKKINDTIYDSMSDHVKTPQEQLLGQHINFSA